MPHAEKQYHRDFRKIWEATRDRLRLIGDEAVQLARRGEKEAARAARIGRIQIDVLNIRRKQDRIHQEIGRRIVELNRRDRINLPGIKSHISRSAALARMMRRQEKALTQIRKSPRRRSRIKKKK